MVAVRVNEQLGTKRKYTFIQRAWLPNLLALWIIVMLYGSRAIYTRMDAVSKERRKDVLVSMCDQRARMLQDQFSVSVNHVHALAILVSTFHYYKNPSAIDQVSVLFPIFTKDFLEFLILYFETKKDHVFPNFLCIFHCNGIIM